MTQADLQGDASASISRAAASGVDASSTDAGAAAPAARGRPSLISKDGINKELLLRKSHAFVNRLLDFSQRKYHLALGRAASAVPEGPVGGLCGLMARLPFTSENILLGYAQGMFPMDKGGKMYWYSPDPRCVLPLEKLHVPSRIKTYMRKRLFELCFDRAPDQVLTACGDRKQTWLTPSLQAAYRELFDVGAMHTVEAWQGERLVGGAFGVALGTVFTVESMFSHEDHASKLAFAYLCQHLVERGFTLVDCQYQQEHFERFGAIEMSREEYRERIARGLIRPPAFVAPAASRAS